MSWNALVLYSYHWRLVHQYNGFRRLGFYDQGGGGGRYHVWLDWRG